MEQEVRDKFEAWVTAAMGGYADLRKSNDPNFAYDDADVDFAYQAWKASRAALRVELPKPEGCLIDVQKYVLNCCKLALQQAGIEVK
ncbi:hypothetical protein [Pseudomonas aeruginosa]|uniref:hypothetical protein n=1 Tax=Pseudomonas aeruginosa TaxID=287 RepID=UPI00157482C4|nr:hypothetical protein [Pseudomonas aeruginosa]NTT99382.1 hypothetical protein [Pseudomonas aeruginosa]